MPRLLNKKIGWDAPLDIDIVVDIPSLRQQIQMYAPRKSGDLIAAFDSADVITYSADENVINIRVGTEHKPWRYARIQDEGGYIKAFDIRKAERLRGRRFLTKAKLYAAGLEDVAGRFNIGGKGERAYAPVMVAMIGGEKRFFTKRRGFHLAGSHYIDKGVMAWWRGRVPVEIKWRSGRAGQGLRRVPGAITS